MLCSYLSNNISCARQLSAVGADKPIFLLLPAHVYAKYLCYSTATTVDNEPTTSIPGIFLYIHPSGRRSTSRLETQGMSIPERPTGQPPSFSLHSAVVIPETLTSRVKQLRAYTACCFSLDNFSVDTVRNIGETSLQYPRKQYLVRIPPSFPLAHTRGSPVDQFRYPSEIPGLCPPRKHEKV